MRISRAIAPDLAVIVVVCIVVIARQTNIHILGKMISSQGDFN